MENLSTKTEKFALDIIKFTEKLPKGRTLYVIANQLIRCGTSPGANYRAARRAKSNADFIYKMGIVEEESDESMYWLDLLVKSGKLKNEDIKDLYKQADEIVAMTVASIKTAKKKK